MPVFCQRSCADLNTQNSPIPNNPIHAAHQLACFLVTALLAACLPTQSVPTPTNATPQRIVSMAPSTTEVLFALGLGDKVVGVTRFCNYPEAARALPKIGGFLDPNFEAILTIQPDLVVLLPVHGDTKTRIHDLGISTLVVDHRTLDGILDSIRSIGEACGAASEATTLLENLHARINSITQKVKGLPTPRVLLSAGRSLGGGRLEEVYVAGKGQWYDDIIHMAGGANAFEDEGVMFPALSGEGLLRLNPDVIVEMTPSLQDGDYTEADVIADWAALSSIAAVRNHRVHVLPQDYVTIPGPRFVNILEDLARILHPEIFKNE